MADARRVLITGASRGIGRAIALAAGKAGYEVVVHYNANEAAAREGVAAIEAMGSRAALMRFDVTDRAAARQAIEADIEANGAYYGIVCNAGITRDNAFPALTDEDWDSVIHTNLDGFFNVIHPAVMPMVRARAPGRIVTMASVSGIIGNRGQVNYSASKAGIIGATKALAVELGKRQITVNCVAPGVIETEMIKDAPLDMILPQIPLARVGRAEEVADLVVFLLSDSAAYITRQVISVNGGLA
ncbi:MAG TPA: 3-ketoacyl-ACP reductase FabG2 [Treponemataceae bacterium]|nr:3-ketoacyl-ACP reductase FabG2 [Treponemataceae bacterium]